MKTLFSTLSLATCLFALAACGTNDGEVAGIEGTGDKADVVVARGTVTGFGSIYVNGVHFNTDTAVVTIDEVAAAEDELSVGMVVDVVGELSASGREGVAHEINAERIVQGAVESVEDLATGRKLVHILGQRVFINEDASFDGIQFDDLMPGVHAQVSGFVAANGMITATHIERGDDAGRMMVDGYITAIDQNTVSFALNDLVVNAAQAVFVTGQLSQLQVGMRVKVQGRLNAATGHFDAERVLLRVPREHGSHVGALEGVLRWRDDAQWWLGDTQLDLASAEIENSSAADLQAGAQVIALGRMTDGILVAEKLIVKSLNTNRFKAPVATIDAQARTFTVLNTLIAVTDFTQFKDESLIHDRYFNFENLRVGEDVEVFAVRLGDQWQATKVVRRDYDGQRPEILRGRAVLTDGSRTFYIDDTAIDGGELGDEIWQQLRSQEHPLVVDVEGFSTGDNQFLATAIRIHALPDCDPQVFFRCDGDSDADMDDEDEDDREGPPPVTGPPDMAR
ncbi:MAG TPA: DUF5666 domain-containing protein [Marinagarivorans sp.]